MCRCCWCSCRVPCASTLCGWCELYKFPLSLLLNMKGTFREKKKTVLKVRWSLIRIAFHRGFHCMNFLHYLPHPVVTHVGLIWRYYPVPNSVHGISSLAGWSHILDQLHVIARKEKAYSCTCKQMLRISKLSWSCTIVFTEFHTYTVLELLRMIRLVWVLLEIWACCVSF